MVPLKKWPNSLNPTPNLSTCKTERYFNWSGNFMHSQLGWTPLYRATLCGSEDAVRTLLKYDADPNIGNSVNFSAFLYSQQLGETPLHQAADNGMSRIAVLLLKHKADPNAQQSDGNTPLHLACFKGDLALAELLLKYGADPNVQNTVAGRTPLHVAVDGYHESIVELLVQNGGSTTIKDQFDKTPVDYAETREMRNVLLPRSRKDPEYVRSTIGDIENKENFVPEQRSRSITSECRKRDDKIVSFDEYLKRAKAVDSQQTNLYQFYQSPSAESGPELEDLRDEDILKVEEALAEKSPSNGLETLKEENSDLEGTSDLREAFEESKSGPIIVLPEKLQSPTMHASSRPVINEVLQYEEIAKDKSPRDTSIHYYIATSKNQSKKNCDLPLKLDTTSELFIRMDTGRSIVNSARTNLNMNYCYPKEVSSTFLYEPSTAECSMRLKLERNGQQLSEYSLQQTMESEGLTVAVFKSQKNDVPSYVNERKRLNLNKSDNRVVADIYNELLNQMQNYSKIDNNTSLEYGDSIFFETINDNYEQFEKMLSQTGKLAKENNDDIIMELESPAEHNAATLNVFPVETCGLQFLNTEKEEEPASRQSYINEDLDRWLESTNLRSIGSSLAKSGINTKAQLIKALQGKPYENVMKYLKESGVTKQGLRDRLLLALDQETGTYKANLAKIMEEYKAAGGRKDGSGTIFGCCGKLPRIVPDFMHPPTLKLWLGRQNLASMYPLFVSAGYDDYEWILAQMCSIYPLTDYVLAKEVNIPQASVRSRLLYKLKEGIALLVSQNVMQKLVSTAS
eukprot:TRINITY_DN202_c0_g2_i1.p1 TRINITY_DN202_c0_g2~~TRINITY_DN202_c0_g2_i1.p1  ORF type:complete len:797 (-),score=69.30 TRINITY_DN202_c0_g2_i1:6071-8461(-)